MTPALLADARRQLAAGDAAAAAAACRAVLADHGDDVEALRLLASATITQGQVAEAADALDRAAALAPLPPASLGDLAAVRLRRGDLDGAAALLGEALAAEPEDAVLWRRRAILDERRGDVAAAERAYAEALRLAPDDAALHNNHGVFLRHQGRHDAAAAALRQAIALDPQRVEYRANLAGTLRMDGRLDAAWTAYREAIALGPLREELRVALVAMLREVGRTADALAVATEAVGILPASALAHVALSATLLDLDRGEEALAAQRAVALAPDKAGGWLHAGNALRQLGRLEAAVESYREALARAPDDVQALSNLGLVLMETGQIEAGRELAERAIGLAPRNTDALHVAGAVAEVAGDLETAERHFREAIRLRPGFAEAQFSLGSAAALPGAVRRRPARLRPALQLRRFATWKRDFPQRLWDGAPIPGRRLLVWGDHGPGDQIMYARLLPMLVAAGVLLTVECEPRRAPLIARTLPGATVVSRADPPHPATATAELQCPTGSLLGRLCRGPSDLPRLPTAHLKANAARAAELRRRYDDGRLLVGLSWHSRHPAIGDEKSLRLADWLPILSIPGCRFVSVQYGDHNAAMAEFTAATGIEILHDPAVDPLRDFAAAADQIAALDLVISISNTAAHLAGALAVPTWTLLSTGRSLFWYWLRDRTDCPWYPSMRLIRQQSRGDWTPVIAEAAASLAERAARR